MLPPRMRVDPIKSGQKQTKMIASNNKFISRLVRFTQWDLPAGKIFNSYHILVSLAVVAGSSGHSM